MPQIAVFPQKDLPVHLKWQIIDFLRMQWPDGFEGPNKFRDWITNEEDHPVSFVLTEGDLLISHAQIVWKELEHLEATYKVYGLTGVMTYPSFQGQGYGMQLVKASKKYIEESDADICMFHGATKGFYDKAGFIPMENMKTLKGDPDNQILSDEIPFMLFLSEKGKKGKEDFEKAPVYFGVETW